MYQKWFANGGLKEEVNYHHGHKHGLQREWYESHDASEPQAIKLETQYDCGFIHSYIISYYQSGNIQHYNTYDHGKKDGDWLHFFDSKLPSGEQPVKELHVYGQDAPIKVGQHLTLTVVLPTGTLPTP